jgi:hypothetical protein
VEEPRFAAGPAVAVLGHRARGTRLGRVADLFRPPRWIASGPNNEFGCQVDKDRMTTASRRDDGFGAIAVVVLLIGTATGNAYVMLGMSVTALILLALFNRQGIGTGAILAAFAAAVTAAIIGIVDSMR